MHHNTTIYFPLKEEKNNFEKRISYNNTASNLQEKKKAQLRCIIILKMVKPDHHLKFEVLNKKKKR